jgi:hypothetical protein
LLISEVKEKEEKRKKKKKGKVRARDTERFGEGRISGRAEES